jgi:hypothetical protein
LWNCMVLEGRRVNRPGGSMKSTHVINKMDEHLGYLSHPDIEAKVTTSNMTSWMPVRCHGITKNMINNILKMCDKYVYMRFSFKPPSLKTLPPSLVFSSLVIHVAPQPRSIGPHCSIVLWPYQRFPSDLAYPRYVILISLSLATPWFFFCNRQVQSNSHPLKFISDCSIDP